MRRLVLVELARYRTRRVIGLLMLAAVLAAALVALKTAWDTRPPSHQEIATARAQADMDAQRVDIRADLQHCLADPRSYLGPGATQQECRDLLTAAPKSYLPREPLDLAGTLKGNGLGVALLVVGLLVIAASTFAGSDWSSGSMATQLLFEPRRPRVWGAKAAAVAIASAVVSLVVVGGFWVAMYAVAQARDIAVPDHVLADIGWHVARVVALAVGAGIGAFALTMLFRHSAATLGLLFACSVSGEILVFLLPVDGVARWSIGNNVFGWLETRLEFFDPTAHCVRLGQCTGPQHISHVDAGAYLLVLLALAVAISLPAFRRRDVG